MMFIVKYFKADNMDDALEQALNSSSIPKQIKKIVKDIIDNYPKNNFNKKKYIWETINKETVECYEENNNNEYTFVVISDKIQNDLMLSCMGRIDESNAIPPFTSNYNKIEDKIFEYEQRIKNKHSERGALFDIDGNILCYASGNDHEISYPILALRKSYYVTHSHPDIADDHANLNFRKIHFGTSFSIKDFNVFLRFRNLKQMRVVFSNGIVMVCEKTKPKLTNADIERCLKLFTLPKIKKQYNDYTLSKEYNPNDNLIDLKRKIVKRSYEKHKSIVSNMGFHIYFYLKDGRKTETLRY